VNLDELGAGQLVIMVEVKSVDHWDSIRLCENATQRLVPPRRRAKKSEDKMSRDKGEIEHAELDRLALKRPPPTCSFGRQCRPRALTCGQAKVVSGELAGGEELIVVEVLLAHVGCCVTFQPSSDVTPAKQSSYR
jgi:hypothetical protein